MAGIVKAVCLSKKKGTRKTKKEMGILVKEHGLKGDAHAGDWHRQVSLLAEESINKIKELEIDYGDFAENITTAGISLSQLPVGTELKIGNKALLEVTQIGKECHDKCEIFEQIGECVMPTEGIFARVITGGKIKTGDKIVVAEKF